MAPGGESDERRGFERRNGDAQRRRDELAEHQRNPYAHGELVGRLQQEGLNIRERFENRLASLERRMAQVLLVGAVTLVLVGALAGVVFQRMIR